MNKQLHFSAFGFLFLSLLCTLPLQAQIERDKQFHFAGGALFGLGGAGLGRQLSDKDPFWTFTGAVGASAVVGIAKEWSDTIQEPGSWSNGDLMATLAGGVFTGVITYLIFKPKEENEVQWSAFSAQTPLLRSFSSPPGLALLGAPGEIQDWVTTSPLP